VTLGKSASGIANAWIRCTYSVAQAVADGNTVSSGNGPIFGIDHIGTFSGGTQGTYYPAPGTTTVGGAAMPYNGSGLYEVNPYAQGGPYGPCDATATAGMTVGTLSQNSTSSQIYLDNLTAGGGGSHGPRQVNIPTTVTKSCSAPAWPTSWFDGTAPPGSAAADVSPPTYTCARSFFSTTAAGQSVVKFTSTRTDTSTSSAFTDTYSWAWGDGATAGTAANPKHTYPATVPDSGWSAVLTVTRTLTSSSTHTFTDSSTTAKTTTCTLTVDPTDPTGTGLVTTDDLDCPSGWGWLNPAAIGTILKCLFIPQHFAEDWGTMMTAFDTHYPTAPLIWAFTSLQDAYTAFTDGLDGYFTAAGTSVDDGGCGYGASWDVNGDGPGGVVEVPVVPCFDEGGALGGVGDVVRPVFGVVIVVGTAFALVRIVSWMMGSGSLNDGGGEE